YYRARGNYVQEAFTRLLWEGPLGYGPGRWGQVNAYFGDPSIGWGGTNGAMWVEVMWPAWVVGGGLPLPVGYVTAIALALRAVIPRGDRGSAVTRWGGR